MWIADLVSGELMDLDTGCQPTWLADRRRLAHIRERGMREGTGIVGRNLAGGGASVVADNDAPLGHEYFPTVTQPIALRGKSGTSKCHQGVGFPSSVPRFRS